MKTIPLTKGKSSLIDDEDYSRLIIFSWHTIPKGRKFYAGRRIFDGTKPHGRIIYMHRILLGVDKGDPEVDHIDGDGLNNQKSNLRLAVGPTNHYNLLLRHDSTSGYKGVHYISDRNLAKPWRAYIMVDYKRKYLGYFSSAEEAALAYNKAALMYFGEFAKLNEVR